MNKYYNSCISRIIDLSSLKISSLFKISTREKLNTNFLQMRTNFGANKCKVIIRNVAKFLIIDITLIIILFKYYKY